MGNFKTLIHEIAKDPAMLIYLDNKDNKRAKPNENFARELLELFSLGEGMYSEPDIKEASRAFAGWRINKELEFVKTKKFQDRGVKVFMGYKGRFDGEDIIDIILKNPQTSYYITSKVYMEFISYGIDQKEVKRIANIFKDSDYDIKTLMYEILMSENFWSNRANLIKSPVELIASTIKSINLYGSHNLKLLTKYSAILGQDILNPPNVKGWDNNKWINSDTFLKRKSFIRRAFRGNGVLKYIKNSGIKSDDEFKRYFLILDNINDKKTNNYKNKLLSLVLDPVFELK